MEQASNPEAIIFIGIPGSGKSSFYAKYFFSSHIRINLDMLKTRHRESIFLNACISGKQNFVVDNTNVTKADRSKYIQLAKSNKFSVYGYFFQSILADCLARNQTRIDKQIIPELGIKGKSKSLEMPSIDEGFDKIFFVKIMPLNDFSIEDWKNEI